MNAFYSDKQRKAVMAKYQRARDSRQKIYGFFKDTDKTEEEVLSGIIDEYEKIVLKTIYWKRIPISTKEISTITVIDWSKTKQVLENLKEKNKVEELDVGNKKLWRIK